MLIVRFRDTLPLLYLFFGGIGVGISPAPVFYPCPYCVRQKGQTMKRYVPMRKANDPHHVELMPVSEEVYAEITRETSRIRNRKQYHGQCACPRKYLWKCDGDCSLCEYSAAGDNLSLSIVENTSLMGVPFPHAIKKAIDVLQTKVGRIEEKNDKEDE